MHFSNKIAPVSYINTSDETYKITTNSDISDLISSIRDIGLITPPILTENNSEFVIISGFRRIAACRQLRLTHIEARIINSETSELQRIKLAITENSFHRQINLVEQSRSFCLLSPFLNYNSLAREASKLGLPNNPSLIKKIKAICHLPGPVQTCILSNIIPLTVANELSLLKEKEQIAFANLFEKLKPSLSRQREIIIYVKEIALREKISISKVLEDNYLTETSNSEELDRTLKTKFIVLYLKKRRFPEITRAEKEFKKNLRDLKLGAGIKLVHPKYFEGNTYLFNLSFNNLQEFKNRLASLNKIINHPSLKKILS